VQTWLKGSVTLLARLKWMKEKKTTHREHSSGYKAGLTDFSGAEHDFRVRGSLASQ